MTHPPPAAPEATDPASPEARRFPIRLQSALRPILLVFGVRRSNAEVRLDGDQLTARFGFFHTEVALSNVERWDITGPYRWWRAVGVRATLGQPELSFGGSAHGGVCLYLRQPIRIVRLRVLRLYLTVDDLEGLGAALAAHGIPGVDRRGA